MIEHLRQFLKRFSSYSNGQLFDYLRTRGDHRFTAQDGFLVWENRYIGMDEPYENLADAIVDILKVDGVER